MKKQNVIVNTLIVCLLIFGIINVSLFPYQNKYEDYKQLNTENDEGFNEIKNQASYTMTISSYGGDTVIYFIHERGSNYIEWDIDLKYDLSGTCANLWQMELWTFNNLQYSYSVETGQYVSNGNAEFFNRNAPPSKSISNDMYASQTCKSSLYLLNTSDGGVSDTTCNPGADGTTFNGADTLSSTINSFTGSGLMAYVYYLLRPSIILNSTFYNTLNTRIEIMDKESNQWIEYNYDSIVLTNPEYKCKIYSLDTNQLIYEDTDYILFANHRTINIDSVKFSNNDDETIIIDTQNNANFKGYYSFNENIVNTQPNESVWDFSTANDDRSYIHSSEDGHNKVLYSNSETMIDYSVKDYKVDGTLDWGNYTDPDLSEFSIESTYDVNVIAEKNQHENVLECSSEANDDYLYAYPDSSTETIIEYWHCSEKNINFVDMRDTSTIIGRIYFSEPNIYVYSGTSFYSVYSSYERGTWIHVRVEFNQNQSTYDVYLDAELVADDYDYYSTTGNGFLYSVNFRSRDGTILYLDSIAFAQDSNYRTFSNRIYQDYKSNTGIIQTNGSIDSAFNYWDYKTSEGATCEQWGNLTDPDLSEWTFYHMGGTIVDLENHRNVLKLNDTGAGLGYTTDDITEQTGTCTVEFWFYMVQQASTFQFMFRDGATNAWSLRINSTLGIELYSNGYSVDETGIYLKKNQWVNFGMVFTKNDDIEFYMNHDSIGILSTGNYDIDSIRIYNPAGPFEFYVDGLGYSWNSYSLYDNSYIYEWFDNSEANSSIDVLSEYYNHNNVLRLYDGSYTGKATITYRLESEMTQGYYDFYIGLNDTSKYISFSLMDGSEGNSIHFAIYSGNLCYYTPSSGWNNLQSAVNNKLYHCAITFNVNYDWNITIDGTFYEELSYYNNPVSMDIIQIRTTGSSYDYYGYIDAIGISNQGYHQLSNIPDGFINNTGNFEFWVNTNDTLTFQLGSQNFYHNTTSISSCVWTHYYYTWNLTSYSLYINSTLEFQNQTFPFNFDSFSWINSSTSQQYYLDAIDSDIFYSNYSIHQNLEVNDTIIWDWNLYPAWVSSHYGLNSSFSDFTITTDGQPEHNIVDFNGHQDVMQIYNEGSTGYTYLDDFTSTNPSQISYELYFAQSSVPEIGGIYITGDSGTAVQIYTQHGGGGMMKAYDGASNTNLFYISANTFYYLRIDVDCLTDTWDMWINDTKYVDGWDFRVNNDYIEKIRIAILDTYFTAASLYIDGYINSEYPEYFPNIARIDNTTVEPLAIPIDNTFSYLNPYHFILSNCSTNILTLHISDMYNNTLEYSSVNKNEEYRYIPDEIRQAFISIRNQQGQYLNWENYRLYLNGTVLYSNTFERVLNSVWNITIKDNFDYQLASTLHTIDRDSNYIDITLTQYSLKIYNQQEVYNYVNITKDPLYYDNDNYWSQWIAPNEIIDYQLYSGYYVVNVSNNEESSFAAYSYTLNNDDILIISSDNTITNTITNIQNVNTTLGNQITAVNITIDNVNSSISNQIVSVDINLGNVNSTLGTQLLNLETALLNVNSSLSVLYASIDTSIVSMNNTIYNAVISSNTSLYTQGNQILGNLTYVLQFNPELTAVLTNTLFSENLTWSNNITTVYEQVDDYSFVNEYNDESLLIELKYENYIKELLLGAQTSITQSIKNEDIEYRVKSINTGQYLSEWADLNDTVVDLGFYDAPLGQTDIYNTEINDWLFLIIVIVIFIGVLVYTIIRLRNTNTIKNSSDNYHNSQRKDLILG